MDAVGLPQAHLACHSLGGQVCLAFALAHRERVRSLTLVSPAGVYRAQQYVRSTIAQRVRVNVGAVAIADPSRTLLALLTDGDGTLVHRFVTRNPATLSMLASFRENLRDRLREVRVPTLAIWGDADLILPMEDGFVLAATLPGAFLHVIEGAGHESQLTHPELVRTWMDEFQRSH
jgi:pimeloyl-ACP methyl ester carboxylesterase